MAVAVQWATRLPTRALAVQVEVVPVEMASLEQTVLPAAVAAVVVAAHPQVVSVQVGEEGPESSSSVT